ARFTSVIDSHKGGWWYHLAAVCGGMFPWSIFLPQAIYNLGSDRFKRPVNGPYQSSPQEEIRLLAICWAFVIVAFFSASVSKLFSYTLPAFPALAIIVAIELEAASQAASMRRLLLPLLAIGITFAAAISIPGINFLLSRVKEAPLDL